MWRLRKKIGIFAMMLCMVLLSLIPANVFAEETEPQVLVNGQVIVRPYSVQMAVNTLYEFSFIVEGAVGYEWYSGNTDGSWFIRYDGDWETSYYSGSRTNTLAMLYRVNVGELRKLKCIAYFADGTSLESDVITISPTINRSQISDILSKGSTLMSYIIGFMGSFLGFIVSNPLILLAFIIVIVGVGLAVFVRIFKGA